MDCFQSTQLRGFEDIFEYRPLFHEDPNIVSSNINIASSNTRPSFTSLSTADEVSEPLSAEPQGLSSNTQCSKSSEIFQEIIFNVPSIWRDTSTSLESHAVQSTRFSPNRMTHEITREPKSRQSTGTSDLTKSRRPREVAESPNEPPKFDINDTRRDHPLYQNATRQGDGLYHCPWEGKEGCQHQPTDLKGKYDKHVDSHLKPYHCKVAVCGHLRFSSAGCLLRHERETHGQHGHGDKQHLCIYEGCERGNPGNGFPRQSNLRDHMKRVHDDLIQTESKAIRYDSVFDEPTKSRKRKADSIDVVEAPRSTAPRPAEIGQLRETRLLERYHQHERRLLEIVKQLHDPWAETNMHLLWDATNCITVMAQTIERIKGVSTSGSVKQANPTELPRHSQTE